MDDASCGETIPGIEIDAQQRGGNRRTAKRFVNLGNFYVCFELFESVYRLRPAPQPCWGLPRGRRVGPSRAVKNCPWGGGVGGGGRLQDGNGRDAIAFKRIDAFRHMQPQQAMAKAVIFVSILLCVVAIAYANSIQDDVMALVKALSFADLKSMKKVPRRFKCPNVS